MACNTFEDIVEVLKAAKINLSDILQACEFMDHEAMNRVLSFKNKELMFEKQAPFYTIIEVASNNDPEVVPEESERLLEFIDSVNDHIVEGLIPQGEA